MLPLLRWFDGLALRGGDAGRRPRWRTPADRAALAAGCGFAVDFRLRASGAGEELALTRWTAGQVRLAQFAHAATGPAIVAGGLLAGVFVSWVRHGVFHGGAAGVALVPLLACVASLGGAFAAATVFLSVGGGQALSRACALAAAWATQVGVMALEPLLRWPLYPMMYSQHRWNSSLGACWPLPLELRSMAPGPGAGHAYPNPELVHLGGRSPDLLLHVGGAVCALLIAFLVLAQFLPRRTPRGPTRLLRDVEVALFLGGVALGAGWCLRQAGVLVPWPIVYGEVLKQALLHATAVAAWALTWRDLRWRGLASG